MYKNRSESKYISMPKNLKIRNVNFYEDPLNLKCAHTKDFYFVPGLKG